MLSVPRSIRLAAWGTAALRGAVPAEQAVAAVRDPGDDVHRVEVFPDVPLSLPTTGLGSFLGALASVGVRGLRAVLPVPGDVSGLPGPATVNALACEAGECVVAIGGRGPTGVAAVPEIERFGSPVEPGISLTWTVHPVPVRPELDVVDLGEADRALRAALAEATTLLRELDVARSRPDVAELWADLASAQLDGRALPPGSSGRAVGVLATALRLRAIIDLASDDDGGAVTGWEVQQRMSALRVLDGVARRAVVAAGNASAG